jgi:hypothetical protein
VRDRWLKFIALVMSVVIVIGIFIAVLCMPAVNHSRRVHLPAGKGFATPRMIEQKYGIHVALDQGYPVKTYHGLIAASNADLRELEIYSSMIAPEFLRYPPGLVLASRLKRIVLCRGLSFAGENRGAIPDFEHDTLYYDVECGSYSSVYQRHTIHHEFFHIIDYQDDGEVYSDERWARLNPKTFRYGEGGAKMQNDPRSGLLREIPGFLTGYATSGVEEDKAEMFAYMITDYAVVEKRALTDSVIRNKMVAMKSLLASFCSEMDQAFWDEVSRRPTKPP